jgi:hypothetical protein
MVGLKYQWHAALPLRYTLHVVLQICMLFLDVAYICICMNNISLHFNTSEIFSKATDKENDNCFCIFLIIDRANTEILCPLSPKSNSQRRVTG